MVEPRYARALLGVREGACVAEIQSAFRAAVRRGRPDLGLTDGEWLTAARAARDLLLTTAAPDRRRRRSITPMAHLLRRSTWRPDGEPDESLTVEL